MKPSPWQRLDGLARRLTPFGLTLGLILLSMVPTHVPGFARVMPMLALMSVYYWSVQWPELLPPLAVFAAGILHDVLSGLPVGVTAIVFLTVHGVVRTQRRFIVGKTFAVLWLGFVVVAAAAAAEAWVLVSAYYFTLVDPKAPLYQFALTAGMFPLVGWLLIKWQNAFLHQD